jgi:hypothetical protein
VRSKSTGRMSTIGIEVCGGVKTVVAGKRAFEVSSEGVNFRD